MSCGLGKVLHKNRERADIDPHVTFTSISARRLINVRPINFYETVAKQSWSSALQHHKARCHAYVPCILVPRIIVLTFATLHSPPECPKVTFKDSQPSHFHIANPNSTLPVRLSPCKTHRKKRCPCNCSKPNTTPKVVNKQLPNLQHLPRPLYCLPDGAGRRGRSS